MAGTQTTAHLKKKKNIDWRRVKRRLRMAWRRRGEGLLALLLAFLAFSAMILWFTYVRPVENIGPIQCEGNLVASLHFPTFTGLNDTTNIYLKVHNQGTDVITATVVLQIAPVEQVEVLEGSTEVELEDFPPQASVSKAIPFRLPGRNEVLALGAFYRSPAIVTLRLYTSVDHRQWSPCVEQATGNQEWYVYLAPLYRMRAIAWGGLLLSVLSAMSTRLMHWLGWKL